MPEFYKRLEDKASGITGLNVFQNKRAFVYSRSFLFFSISFIFDIFYTDIQLKLTLFHKYCKLGKFYGEAHEQHFSKINRNGINKL